jgi:hypothetical protein
VENSHVHSNRVRTYVRIIAESLDADGADTLMRANLALSLTSEPHTAELEGPAVIEVWYEPRSTGAPCGALLRAGGCCDAPHVAAFRCAAVAGRGGQA